MTVRVSGVSRGRARLCLQYETGKPACINVANGTLTGKTKKRSTGWTITLAGATNGESPTAVLTISFPTRGPSLDLEDFRLAGTTSANGMRARVTARGPGSLRYSATWPDPTAYTAKAVDVGTGKTVRSTSGTATSAVIAVAVVRNHRYDITFGPRGSASADDIYFAAGLSWP